MRFRPDRYLIVNADDFGQSDGVNRGIIDAHENGIVTSAQRIKSSPDQVRRIVRASLQSLYDFRRNKASAIEFLAAHFEIPKNIAAKSYANGLDILTRDGEISAEKLRQILSMMQDTGKKDTVTVSAPSLVDFSFLREAQKELK